MARIGVIFQKLEYVFGIVNAAFKGANEYAKNRNNPFKSNPSRGWSSRVSADEVEETDTNAAGHSEGRGRRDMGSRRGEVEDIEKQRRQRKPSGVREDVKDEKKESENE